MTEFRNKAWTTSIVSTAAEPTSYAASAFQGQQQSTEKKHAEVSIVANRVLIKQDNMNGNVYEFLVLCNIIEYISSMPLEDTDHQTWRFFLRTV